VVVQNSHWDVCRSGNDYCAIEHSATSCSGMDETACASQTGCHWNPDEEDCFGEYDVSNNNATPYGCTGVNGISPNDDYFYNLSNQPMLSWSYNPSWSGECNISGNTPGFPILSDLPEQSCMQGPACAQEQLETYYKDFDGDGFGNASNSIESEQQPEGYVEDNTDCDDSNGAVNPAATEVCNGIDDNCNQQIDEEFDQDQDGIADCFDNCPTFGYGYGYADPDQTDIDQDGIGDVCDNCPNDYNPYQEDKNENGIGNACEKHEKQPPSEMPEELLPLNILIDSIICQYDGTGTITIEALDYKGRPLPGVLIEISGESGTTGDDGKVTLAGFGKGEYSVSASREGYETASYDFAVSCQKRETPKPAEPGAIELLTLNIILKETIYNNDGTANVEFLVTDSYNNPISDAMVGITGNGIIYFTGNDGTLIINSVKGGTYNATASKRGYSEDQTDFTIKFEVKKEPAQVPEKPAIEEETKQIFSVPYCPILIILAILVILYILWKRRKKKEQVDEEQTKKGKK
jgi:hypothetical protein